MLSTLLSTRLGSMLGSIDHWHPIVLYIGPYLILGGVGMAVANRSVLPAVAAGRWLKYGTYIVIVGGAVASMLLGQFFWVAGGIAALGLGEVLWAQARGQIPWAWRGAIALGYGAIALGFLEFAHQGRSNLWLFAYFQVFSFDGFSQIIGQLWGHRPLAASISPTKTWEGFLGGLGMCLLSALLACSWVDLSWSMALVAGGGTALLALGGDLLASSLKRRCQIKDYSPLLPGQGGILDRFDSFMLVGMGYGLALGLGLF